MPEISVVRLVKHTTEVSLIDLKEALLKAVEKISELKLHRNDIIVHFPLEAMTRFTDEKDEIIIHVDCLFDKKERTVDIKRRLQTDLAQVCKSFYSDARVQCTLRTVNEVSEIIIIDSDD